MSVIVTGMQIPENCGRCRFIGSCGVHGNEEWPDIESIMFNDVIGIDGKRDKDCPLRPLPKKHGRLIDADDMERFMSDTVQGDIRQYPYSDTLWDMAFKWIDSRPTIVEAEGERDG